MAAYQFAPVRRDLTHTRLMGEALQNLRRIVVNVPVFLGLTSGMFAPCDAWCRMRLDAEALLGSETEEEWYDSGEHPAEAQGTRGRA